MVLGLGSMSIVRGVGKGFRYVIGFRTGFGFLAQGLELLFECNYRARWFRVDKAEVAKTPNKLGYCIQEVDGDWNLHLNSILLFPD